MESIYDKAKENNTFLEINSFPDRLDLNDMHSKTAKERGVKFVIGTDSHTLNQLSFIKYGIATARRGWLSKKDILNTHSLKELERQEKTRNPDVVYNTLDDVHKVGGFVMNPAERGIYHNVLRIDFSKFYPEMIKSTNSGIITAINVIEEGDDYIYGTGVNVGEDREENPLITKKWLRKERRVFL